MRFENARVYGTDFCFHKGGFSVENGRFTMALQGANEACEDLCGATVIPGLIDIHNHGNSGCDFSDGEMEGLRTIARYLAQHGITSFAPASMTLCEEQLTKAYESAARFFEEGDEMSAVLRGINMEGPFFSAEKKGAQNPLYLHAPDLAMFSRLNSAAKGLIKLVDIAPELPGALDFIKQASKVCTVSLAHTNASYEEAAAAIRAGASHVTHLFNAMPELLHREPGVIGAAAEAGSVNAELICDGVHVHPSAVRAALTMFGAGRICLISDALPCCGMPKGEHMLGGQKIKLDGTIARLADGSNTIAGSASNLFTILRLALSFGIDEGDAVRMATWNPACVLKVQNEVGAIREGMKADFLICGEDYELRRVYIGGRCVMMKN